jgi:hypothetical protein
MQSISKNAEQNHPAIAQPDSVQVGGPPDRRPTWQHGDPCEHCGKPVDIADRQRFRRVHIACQREISRAKKRAALSRWRAKNPHRQAARPPKPAQHQKTTVIPRKPAAPGAAPVPAVELARMSKGVSATFSTLPDFQEALRLDRANGVPYSRRAR